MGEIIVSSFVTLDGVMEAPGGEPGHPHTGWVVPFMDDEHIAWKQREAEEAAALLVGRITYESLAGGWSERTGAFADRMNTMPKKVISSTLVNPEWPYCQVISDDVLGGIRALKEQVDGHLLVVGSISLVHALFREGLVDAFRLLIAPITVGSGRKLFPDTREMTPFTLSGVDTFANGANILTYQPCRSAQ